MIRFELQDQLPMPDPSPQQFCTTHWTTALSARAGDVAALEALCRAYWYPLYLFVRRKGNSPEESQDLVQGFFEQIPAKDFLQSVDRDKGRFRNFLLALRFSLPGERVPDRKNRRKTRRGTRRRFD